MFTSSASPSVAENQTTVTTVVASDADLPAQTVTFSITGGVDQARFSITSGGVLTFVSAPDFENPTDANTNNVYLVQVMADDGNGGTTTQNLSVSVVNQPEGTAGNDVFVLTYSASTVAITVGATNLGTFPLAAPLTLYGLGGTDSVRIVGTSGSDVIRVSSSGGVQVNGATLILNSTESLLLAGGAGNDIYRFDADSALGLISLDEGLGGTDTLDFSLTDTAAISINLSLATNQIVNPNLSLILTSATTFENVTGGSGNDNLTGNAAANILTGNAGNDVLTGNAGDDVLTGNAGDDVLEGGAGNDSLLGGANNDTYRFAADTALGADTLTESGTGTDLLDFSAT